MVRMKFNGYQFSLVEIDGKDYPQLSQPSHHKLPIFLLFTFILHALLFCCALLVVSTVYFLGHCFLYPTRERIANGVPA